MASSITLRPITPEDEEFLYRVYASTREEELAVLDWDETQGEAFLRMQFNAQHTYYVHQFGQAAFDLILLDGEPIGRLYVDRRADEIRIIDIALLTEYRRQGIGSRLMKGILVEAESAGLPVRIHVEQNNPALGLYTRLGFERIGDEGVYYLMEWRPGSSDSGPSMIIQGGSDMGAQFSTDSSQLCVAEDTRKSFEIAAGTNGGTPTVTVPIAAHNLIQVTVTFTILQDQGFVTYGVRSTSDTVTKLTTRPDNTAQSLNAGGTGWTVCTRTDFFKASFTPTEDHPTAEATFEVYFDEVDPERSASGSAFIITAEIAGDIAPA